MVEGKGFDLCLWTGEVRIGRLQGLLRRFESPSVDMSEVGCVDENAGQFLTDGRDLNGARSMRALPRDDGREGVPPSLN